MFVHNVQFPQQIIAFTYIDKLIKTHFDFTFVYFFLISATFEVFPLKPFLWQSLLHQWVKARVIMTGLGQSQPPLEPWPFHHLPITLDFSFLGMFIDASPNPYLLLIIKWMGFCRSAACTTLLLGVRVEALPGLPLPCSSQCLLLGQLLCVTTAQTASLTAFASFFLPGHVTA